MSDASALMAETQGPSVLPPIKYASAFLLARLEHQMPMPMTAAIYSVIEIKY